MSNEPEPGAPVIRRGNVHYLTGTEVPLAELMALWYANQAMGRAAGAGAVVSLRALYYPGLTEEQIARAIAWARVGRIAQAVAGAEARPKEQEAGGGDRA